MRVALHYGLTAVEPLVDLKSVMAHVQDVIAEVYAEESPEALRQDGIDVYLGEARFANPHTLMVRPSSPQAASETGLLGGNNLTHDIGYLESGKTSSPELVVLCDEIISMMRRFMGGISLDESSMAMDVIHQVGPDNDFLTSRHTFEHFRRLWRPTLFNRLGGEEWETAGSKRVAERVKEKTISIMEEHRSEPLADGAREEIDYILER